MITLFTPTYNRAHLLSRLYNSILMQDVIDVEWLIVDDGSIDDTEALIENFKKESIINIRYYKNLMEENTLPLILDCNMQKVNCFL